MILRPFAATALAVAALAFPATSAAELVTLTSGRTLSVRSVVVTGAEAVLTLHGGGEMRCAASLLARVEPDEVPHPAPEAEADPAAAATAASQTVTEVAGSDAVRLPAASATYASVIDAAAKRHAVDPRLVHAVIAVESRYQPRARSAKGAMGMMQLMPATARELRVRDPYDATANIEGGVRYLRQLLDRFELRLALAAYNAGAATVERYGGVPPYPETRSYVARVLRLVGAS